MITERIQNTDILPCLDLWLLLAYGYNHTIEHENLLKTIQNLTKFDFPGSDLIPGGSPVLNLVERDKWLARPPETPIENLELPASRVIIAHTVTQNCSTQVQSYGIQTRSLLYNLAASAIQKLSKIFKLFR